MARSILLCVFQTFSKTSKPLFGPGPYHCTRTVGWVPKRGYCVEYSSLITVRWAGQSALVDLDTPDANPCALRWWCTGRILAIWSPHLCGVSTAPAGLGLRRHACQVSSSFLVYASLYLVSLAWLFCFEVFSLCVTFDLVVRFF